MDCSINIRKMNHKLETFINNYKPKKIIDGKGKSVLISMMRPVPQQYIEIIIAKILKANNFHPTIIFANKDMFLEDFQFRTDYRKYTGWIKYKFFFKFLFHKRLKKYQEICKKNNISHETIPNEFKYLEYELSVDDINNIQSTNNRITAGIDKKIPEFLKKRIFNNVSHISGYIKKNKFDLCISSHGIYSLWGSIYKNMPNKILIWGGDVYNTGNMLVSKGPIQLTKPIEASNKKSLSFEEWCQSRAERRSEDQASFANYNNEFFFYGNKRKLNSKNEFANLFPNDKRNIVIMPNTLWDGAISGRDVAFSNQIDWINKTATIADIRIIIRAHPAENSLKKFSPKIWDLLDKETRKNIIFFPSDFIYNSYDFSEYADICCIYDSIIGLELNGLGKNVIVCANNRHYLDMNWHIPTTFKEYKNRLQKFKIKENRYELAKAAYYRLLNGSIHIPFWQGETDRFIKKNVYKNNWEDVFINLIVDNYIND